MNTTIRVSDLNGAHIMLFVKLEEDHYFGGLTKGALARHYPDFGVPGPHVWYTTDGLLGIIARIANEQDGQIPHGLSSDKWSTHIAGEMAADELAKTLDCDEAAVHARFDRLVTLRDKRA